jgi:hypothetical protein
VAFLPLAVVQAMAVKDEEEPECTGNTRVPDAITGGERITAPCAVITYLTWDTAARVRPGRNAPKGTLFLRNSG